MTDEKFGTKNKTNLTVFVFTRYNVIILTVDCRMLTMTTIENTLPSVDSKNKLN